MALPVSRLVRASINLTPLAAARRNFGILLACGDSDVIPASERLRSFASYDEVATLFGVDAPESMAAAAYFGQSPAPRTMMVGRWLRTASAAANIGGILTASQQLLSNWTVISNGGLVIVIDGVTKTLTGLNFTAVTNLNGVATVITSALSASGTCTWDGEKFTITSATTGAGVKATGTVTFDTNAANNDTLTLNGTLITFVSGTPSGSQVKIGASLEATAANLQVFLNASIVSAILEADYSTSLGVLTITYKTVGTGGNAYTIAKSSTHITISAATLAGGLVPSSVGYATVGAVATQMKLTSTTNIALVDGYDAESPAACVLAMANKSAQWYGVTFAASVQPTDDQSVAVATVVEALELARVFGVTIQDTDVLSSLVEDDLASRLKDGGYYQSLCQYSSSSAYAICSLLGRAFAVDFDQNSSTITLMYKQEPGIEGEELTTEQANVLQDKRCNVYVNYVNDTKIIQYGVMSGPAYIDEIHGLDWLQDAVQNACYNLMYTSPTKIPQTDAGSNQFVNAINAVLDSAGTPVGNGLIGPGTWTSTLEFGTLKTGDFLKTGYYVYVQPMALQSQPDREARICPPIQIAIKLAGAIQEVDVAINVNR